MWRERRYAVSTALKGPGVKEAIMDFYQSIAAHYDDIFPLDEAQVAFVGAAVPGPPQKREVLDVGCGTGSLALALARDGYRVTGIDLDGTMVALAAKKGRGLPGLRYQQMDMRSLLGVFRPSSLDAILCFGNTLVHLTQGDTRSFCVTSRELIKGRGRLLLQILNYDHILTARLPGLPVIENDRIRFERNYHYTEAGSLIFRTALTVKATGALLENEVPLYPLRKNELEGLLKEAGFSEIRFYGSFRRTPLEIDSLPLVAEARVPD